MDIPAEVHDFLSSFSSEVRILSLQTRDLILDVMPGAVEQVDAPSRLISYGTGVKMAQIVCVLMPLKSAVNLGIYRAVELPDPYGLLEGTGKLHRHVKIRSAQDLAHPGLKELLEAAYRAKGAS